MLNSRQAGASPPASAETPARLFASDIAAEQKPDCWQPSTVSFFATRRLRDGEVEHGVLDVGAVQRPRYPNDINYRFWLSRFSIVVQARDQNVLQRRLWP